ncbi:hypothetical protein [Glaciimonas sp. PCH181]|uniref:hypothetical protein n=1 Tax=Glaciimonas sp. PCH181 TaxID=2133943 RepID=UPI000D3852D6|nr:hypothetical protein [Glaciimonas sp. PCH181]PUA19610.1 hypothetical protein C7W93_07130 [Glaciimonas sp. PCH181]
MTTTTTQASEEIKGFSIPDLIAAKRAAAAEEMFKTNHFERHGVELKMSNPDIDKALTHYSEQLRLVRNQKDSIRLDWLEANLLTIPRKVHFVNVCGDVQFYSLENVLIGNGADLRRAVDSSIAKTVLPKTAATGRPPIG